MRIVAYAVPAFVACAFFLYVAIQFHRDEKRRGRRADSQAAPPASRVVELAAAAAVGRGPSGKSHTASKDEATRARRAGGHLQREDLKLQLRDSNRNRMPYIEMTLPVAAVVTHGTDLIEGAQDTPPRRIA